MTTTTSLYTSNLEYNVDFVNAIIYIEGEIGTYSAPFFLERLNAIKEYRKNITPDKINDPINLYITSIGGDVYGLLALLDIIRSQSVKINTYGFGEISSAAIWLLASGTGVRYIGPNTQCMIHEISTWLMGSSSDIENEAKQLKHMQNLAYKLINEYTKKDKNFWPNKINKKNLYLTPEKCIEYGIADEIIKTI